MTFAERAREDLDTNRCRVAPRKFQEIAKGTGARVVEPTVEQPYYHLVLKVEGIRDMIIAADPSIED